MKRKNISSGTPWEPLIGFSRAVRVGNQIFISGTTPTNAKGDVIDIGDHYLQTKRIIQNIKTTLEGCGASLSDVVKTSMFVTDVSKWKLYCKAHEEAFKDIRPAHSMLQIERLIDPRMLISMEAIAIVGASEVESDALEVY